jgi:hypothetical protein
MKSSRSYAKTPGGQQARVKHTGDERDNLEIFI